MLDLKHEFFNPLWIRVTTTAVAGGWAVFEFSAGAPFWGIVFAALAALCGWNFFYAWHRDAGSPAGQSSHKPTD